MMDLSGKNVLVTGATGLLGRPLVDGLLKRGALVTGMAFEPRPADFPSDAKYICFDMNDDELLTGVLEDIEYVFHLAGAKGGVGIGRSKSHDFLMANLRSTINLFDAIRNVQEHYISKLQRVLFVSSVGAYPGDRTFFSESEDIWLGPPHHSDFFGGVAKRFGEVICKSYHEQYGLDYVIVRPTNCFGPFDRFDPETGMVIAALIARIEAGENPLQVWGDGTARRDFLYSKDCAEGMIRVMERGESGEAYNLGTGYTWSLDEILYQLRCCYSPPITWHFDTSKPSGPAIRTMNVRKVHALGWFQQYPILKALQETIEWYRANANYQKYDPFKN